MTDLTLPIRVFVYGTLRRGQPNHYHLSGSRYLGLAQTPPAYTLYDLGPYPAMVAGGQTTVKGELYEVTSEVLADLDRLEGHPCYYRRGMVVLADDSKALTYLLRPEQVRGAPVIEGGEWVK